MIQNFAIDQAATFESLLFLSCEPKTASATVPAGDHQGRQPKWEAQLVARFRQFGRATNEIIKVGLASSASPPGTDLARPTPVELVGFEIGVMDKKDRNGNVTGAQVWYRCQEVRAMAATGSRGKSAEAG